MLQNQKININFVQISGNDIKKKITPTPRCAAASQLQRAGGDCGQAAIGVAAGEDLRAGAVESQGGLTGALWIMPLKVLEPPAGTRVRVVVRPRLMTVPPPDSERMVCARPARSRLAPLATVSGEAADKLPGSPLPTVPPASVPPLTVVGCYSSRAGAVRTTLPGPLGHCQTRRRP